MEILRYETRTKWDELNICGLNLCFCFPTFFFSFVFCNLSVFEHILANFSLFFSSQPSQRTYSKSLNEFFCHEFFNEFLCHVFLSILMHLPKIVPLKRCKRNISRNEQKCCIQLRMQPD